jgi:hypothetical protein
MPAKVKRSIRGQGACRNDAAPGSKAPLHLATLPIQRVDGVIG